MAKVIKKKVQLKKKTTRKRFVEPVFYFEHYPHYMGTMNSQAKIEIADLDELSDLYIAAKDRKNVEAQNAYDELYEERLLSENGYAWYEIIENWPALRRALETKGVYADEWEEGSHGLSMTSAKDAAKVCLEVEKEVQLRCMEQDWDF